MRIENEKKKLFYRPHNIGITGYNASGKGKVVSLLEKKGFRALSLSDLLREEAKKRNLEVTRENLTQLGQDLRSQRNSGFLADLAIQSIDPNHHYVIDSIRHPEEIKILKQHLTPFILLGIDAPIETRFERSQIRGRQENAHTLEEFRLRERAEMKNNPNSQQLHKCMELCDVHIMNDGTLEDFEAKILNILNRYSD